jgi:hypothetical protein
VLSGQFEFRTERVWRDPWKLWIRSTSWLFPEKWQLMQARRTMDGGRALKNMARVSPFEKKRSKLVPTTWRCSMQGRRERRERRQNDEGVYIQSLAWLNPGCAKKSNTFLAIPGFAAMISLSILARGSDRMYTLLNNWCCAAERRIGEADAQALSVCEASLLRGHRLRGLSSPSSLTTSSSRSELRVGGMRHAKGNRDGRAAHLSLLLSHDIRVSTEF